MTVREEMTMAGQILVPLDSHLRAKDIIPVIEEAAKPGMRVVFLVRYPVDPWVWFRDNWITTESARDAMLAGRKVMERYSWEGQRALAEEMIAPWRYALQRMGVKVAVDVYTGSLPSVVENYSCGDEISLVMRAKNNPIMGFLHRPIAFILKAARSLTGPTRVRSTSELRSVAIRSEPKSSSTLQSSFALKAHR
jgi:hypothetical protein